MWYWEELSVCSPSSPAAALLLLSPRPRPGTTAPARISPTAHEASPGGSGSLLSSSGSSLRQASGSLWRRPAPRPRHLRPLSPGLAKPWPCLWAPLASLHFSGFSLKVTT